MSEERPAPAEGTPMRPPKEINVSEICRVIRQRFWIVLLSTILLTAAGGWYASRPEVPLYAANARLLIPAESPEQMNTLKVIVREPLVMRSVAETLQLEQPPAYLREQVRVGNVDNSAVTIISAIDTDPDRAAAIANAVAAEFIKVARERIGFSGISVLTEAAAVDVPVNPPSSRALYAGLFGGLVAGLVLVFVRDSLDDTVKSQEDIEWLLKTAPLGHVPKIRSRDVRRGGRKKNMALRGETIGS